MTNSTTATNRERIRISVSEGFDDAVCISAETNIAHPEVTRLLNLLCKESNSGVVKTRRGHYGWSEKVPKPKVDKPITWLGVLMSWIK